MEYGWFKKALTKPFSKLIFALAFTGAVTGTIGLVLGSISINKTNNLTYYLKPDYTAVWGEGTIWETKTISGSFSLYFAKEKKDINDIKWNGKYPKGYFNDEKS